MNKEINNITDLFLPRNENDDSKIWLPNRNDILNLNIDKKKKSATDFTTYTKVVGSETTPETLSHSNRETSRYILQDENNQVVFVNLNGNFSTNNFTHIDDCFPLTMRIDLDISELLKENITLNENVKQQLEQILGSITKKDYDLGSCFTLKMGEYPQKHVSKEEEKELEETYNAGYLSEGMKATNNSYIVNGTKDWIPSFENRHIPEFTYKGKKYVRMMYGESDAEAKWFLVEPLTFQILNYENLPKILNTNGNGTDTHLKLLSEECVISKIPYVYQNNSMSFTRRITYPNIWENSIIKGFFNGNNMENIPDANNIDLNINSRCDFSKYGGLIDNAFLKEKSNLKSYTISERLPINKYELNGFTNISRVIIPRVRSLDEEIGTAFNQTHFKYVVDNEDKDFIILSNQLPKNEELLKSTKDISAYQKVFIDIDYSIFFNENKNILKKYEKIREKLEKNNYKIPFSYASHLIHYGYDDFFLENAELSFFKNEFPNLEKMLSKYSKEEKLAFMIFAHKFGCFSKEKVKGKNGVESKTMLCQRATSVLKKIMNKNALPLGSNFGTITNLLIADDKTTNNNFLKFVEVKNEKGEFNNLKVLLDLELELDSLGLPLHQGIFKNTMCQFDKVMKLRKQIDSCGKLVTVPWPVCMKQFNATKPYLSVPQKYEEMAELYSSLGISESDYEFIKGRYDLAEKKKIPKSLISKHLKEETDLKICKNIRDFIQNELLYSTEILEDIDSKFFTYEVLDKDDIHNAIIGKYASCCANITREDNFYGAKIADGVITTPNTQNIVVRNAVGEIIGKGTIYVDKENQQAILNDFEINDIYKSHQSQEVAGFYFCGKQDAEYKTRESILNCFERAIKAFIQQYNKDHPNQTLKKVNVGGGYNRLKMHCEERYKYEPNLIKTPVSVPFLDIKDSQFIVYEDAGKRER